MISLFIDTSLSNVSISILKDGKILSIINENIPNEHSKYATSYVKKALDLAKVDALDVEKIFVVNGPGSFTGVRIGVTIAKTYGYLINKGIIPVSSLKSLALSCKHDSLVMSIIPANKSNYYVGIYNNKNTSIIDEMCVNKEQLLELIKQYNPYIISNESNIIGEYNVNKVNLDIEKIVDYYKDFDVVNYYAIVPNYLKLPSALESK